MTLASALPAIGAEAAPEPELAQGEYNPQYAEPLSMPLIAGQARSHAVELLSPAGGLDAGYAAFHYGADAIYLGMKKFSARAEAENFTLDDIDAITSFAHSMPASSNTQNPSPYPLPQGEGKQQQEQKRRVFVTINTLILQNEMKELIEALGALADIGVDALIIQDLGVYNIVRKHFPELELHASTQLAVHDRAGAEALRQMGFARVVLARELTLEEVRDITATSGIETEVFIHGALCYSYSGLCLFSAQTLGRSGNRGKCAYSCRDSFQVSGAPDTLRDGSNVKRSADQGFAFSMKDLALPDHLPALQEAGVSCVKIEGRKKSPLYVATTTDYYRRLLDGKLSDAERHSKEADMQTVFSRPWTRLFMQSHKYKEVADRDTVGHRGTPIGSVQEIINPGSESPLLRFVTSRAIQRHDGLQIDVPGLGKPFGFAVETLRIVSSKQAGSLRSARVDGNAYEAPAESMVEVAMPEEHPPIPVGAPIYCSSSQDVKMRYRHSTPKPGQFRARRRVDFNLSVDSTGVRASATIAARSEHEPDIQVQHALAGKFEAAKDSARMEQAARGAFEKLGETCLEMSGFVFENPRSLFVPVSQLNQLRRDVCDALQRKITQALERRAANVEATVLNPSPPTPLPLNKGARGDTAGAGRPRSINSGASQIDEALKWSIKVDRIEFLDSFDAEDWAGVDELTVDLARDHISLLMERLDAIAAQIGREHIRLAIPALTRKWEEKGLLLKLQKLRAAGWKRWEASNVSAWTYLNLRPDGSDRAELDLATDWAVYVINRAAAEQVLEMGATRFALSPEDGIGNMRSLLAEYGERAVVIVHQDTPLFVAESCAYANLIGGCPGKANCRFESMEMVSASGEKVSAVDYHCRTIVLNRGPFCLTPRLAELRAAGARSVRADFIYRKYEPAAVQKAWRLLRAGKNVAGGHAANFDRGLL